MTKAVAKKQNNEVSVYNDQDLGAWGGNEFSQSDIIIPKLILMQASSTLLVEHEDLKSGDYIHSVTKEKVGSAKEPVEFVPFMMKKLWRVSLAEGKDFKFAYMEQRDESNEDAPKEFTVNGKAAQRQKVFQFYSFVGNETIPMIITMKGMSFNTGKQLANEMYLTNPVLNLPPPGRTFSLSVEDTDYENKKYKMYAIKEVGETPEDLVKGKIFKWYKTIAAGSLKEHSEEEVDAVETQASEVQEHPTSESVEVNGQF